MATMDNLVRQVQELESATTDLLDATNLSKQTLDEAVDSAKGSTGSAKTDSGTATSAKNESVKARNESVAAKDEAEAIVHQGEGSTTPGGGKYPVAYSDGQIDSGWIPMLQAMYPYSGVIGSVDKGDLFYFYANVADKFGIKPFSCNINGRFVAVSSTNITLPEAESTAARAIAFDDIFLDWSGEVTNYRSVTPHRTTTGYNSDAIATEHGYTKVQNGLYKVGDTYALLLGRVARRNQGAYHPLWNPEGSRRYWHELLGSTCKVRWFQTTNGVSIDSFINSTLDCYDVGAEGESKVTGESGSIGYTNSGSPCNKFHDAIYANDFTPLYYSAKNVIDRQALLFDSFNKAVAGETFSGAEGTNGSVTGVCDFVQHEGRTVRIEGINGAFLPSSSKNYTFQSIYIYNHTQGITVQYRTNYNYYWVPSGERSKAEFYIETTGTIKRGDVCTVVVNYGSSPVNPLIRSQQPSARPQFLACDIIGSLDAMPPEWLKNGICGNWLAVGEEGEDLIPDGTTKNFKLSRKCLDCYLVLSTTDNGDNWSDRTSEFQNGFEGSGNSIKANPQVDFCMMVFYRATANPFELTTTATIRAINQGYRFNDNQVWRGNLVTERMIGKISTASHTHIRYPIQTDNGSYLTRLNNPAHSPLTLNESSSRAVKVLPYLGSIETAFTLNSAYKEQKYKDGSWGDDNKFNIVDHQSTVTDLNGEQVIVGQKRCALPYHFGETF